MGNDKDFQIVYKVPSTVKQHNGLPETIHLEQVCKRRAINDIVILLYDSIKMYRYRLKCIKKSSITRQLYNKYFLFVYQPCKNHMVIIYVDEVTVADLRPDLFVQRTLLTKPKELLKADLVTVDWDTCRRQLSGQLTERMMCAGDPNNKTDICSVSITKVENLVKVLWFYLYLPWLLFLFFPPTAIYIHPVCSNFSYSNFGICSKFPIHTHAHIHQYTQIKLSSLTHFKAQ